MSVASDWTERDQQFHDLALEWAKRTVEEPDACARIPVPVDEWVSAAARHGERLRALAANDYECVL